MKRSTELLMAIAASFLCVGFIDAFLPPRKMPHTLLDLVHTLLLFALLYAWCRTDMTERGVTPTYRAALWAALFPVIGLPVYFFKTRATKAAWRGVANSLGFVLLIVMAAVGLLSGELVAK